MQKMRDAKTLCVQSGTQYTRNKILNVMCSVHRKQWSGENTGSHCRSMCFWSNSNLIHTKKYLIVNFNLYC